MPSAIEIVFFDAFGTLIHLPSSVGEHYRQVGLRHGYDLPSDALNRAFRARFKAAPPRQNTTSGPRSDDDKGWWRTLVRKVIADATQATASAPLDFDVFFDDLYAHFAQPGVWSAFPEVPAVLAELQTRGLRLGIISNFDRRLYQILEGLALRCYFETVVISSEVGADKPDPVIFQTALRLAKVEAEAAVHVGDEPERDWGAAAVGMNVYKLQRPRQTLAGLPDWLAARSKGENGLASRPDLK